MEIIVVGIVIGVIVGGYWLWQRRQLQSTFRQTGQLIDKKEGIDFEDLSQDEHVPQAPQAERNRQQSSVAPPSPQPPKPQKPDTLSAKEVEDFLEEITGEKLEREVNDQVIFGDVLDGVLEESEPILDVTYPEKQVPSATTAHFSAFYPREATVGARYGVVLYAHAEDMLSTITTDIEKFKTELGGHIPQPRTAKQAKILTHGSLITVMLESDELQFEPDMLTKTWHGDWTRFLFEFRPQADYADETAFVRASIMVMGFEIASIKFAIDIQGAQDMAMDAQTVPDNPFAQAKMETTTTQGYDKIFISYSREDTLIAEAFKIVQEASGNDVFFDVDDIRTGADWQAAIARAIDEADYFQLFWSENSAGSEWCGYEWDYALRYRCQDSDCKEFIRPVWWETPMPDPPESMSHLNFKRMNLEALMRLLK